MIPAYVEHGPYRIAGVRTAAGYQPWDDFTTDAVLAICLRLSRDLSTAAVERERVNRDRIARRHICQRCGCLLDNGEDCPGCAAGFLR